MVQPIQMVDGDHHQSALHLQHTVKRFQKVGQGLGFLVLLIVLLFLLNENVFLKESFMVNPDLFPLFNNVLQSSTIDIF